MKKVKKFTSFEDLKSSENKTIDLKLALEKHSNFEKAIRDIWSVKNRQNVNEPFK